MPFQKKVKIIQNKKLQRDCYGCILSAPEIARVARPGQFVNLRVASGTVPLLRRPISIHSAAGNKIELLYQVLGEGTRLLSKKKPGELLDIIGPLGKGFDYRSSAQARGSQILVAGGMGTAPLLFLAEKLVHSKPLVLLGAKTKGLLLCEKEFKKIGCGVTISTDDGSRGFKGRVTDLLNHELLTRNHEPAVIYACGPHPMLKATAAIAAKYGMPAQVSLEAHMACGIGACLGCVTETRSGLKCVCKEGPVFNADEIIW
jgi:dihydroorotate dehydrogenase electron transfer subunit